MLDNTGEFIGAAAKEIAEETGMHISQQSLKELTGEVRLPPGPPTLRTVRRDQATERATCAAQLARCASWLLAAQ